VTVWRWIGATVVFAVHDRQIAQHGGRDGVRDLGTVESALARPQNLQAYGNPDTVDLAAAYAFGLARNHGFHDGNKRTAWIVARLFVADNGTRIKCDPLPGDSDNGSRRRRNVNRNRASRLVPPVYRVAPLNQPARGTAAAMTAAVP